VDFFGTLLLDIAMVCLVNCTNTQPRLPEVVLPPKRIVQLGYSVTPPNERGWFAARRTPTFLALVKAGKNPDDTIAIEARAYERAAQQPRREQPLLPGENAPGVADRFKLVKSDVLPDPREGCERRQIVTEDRAPARRSGGNGAMILEVLLLSCVHPRDAALAIDLAYSARYEPEQRDAGFDAAGARLLQSLEFTEPGRAMQGGQNVR
jgi:hypothetical protein